MVQLKADYMTVVSAAQKIGNVFNFSHETVEAWVEAINNSGMPTTLLEERTNHLISTWDNKTNYGKPSPADLIQGYSDTQGTYTARQVGWIVGCMVSDRLGGDESEFAVLRSTIHNLVVHKIFDFISEEGVIKRDKNGDALFTLSAKGKEYASEIKQRITNAELRRIERELYPQAWRDEWAKMKYTDIEILLKKWDREGKDLLCSPFQVVDRN